MSIKHSKMKGPYQNTVIILAVLVVISMVTRLLFMGTYLEGWDSIDFALGLHDYDIAYYQPHFPGYPVYMFFCRLVHIFVDNDVIALTVPGAVLGSITLVPFFFLTRRMFTENTAWLAVFLYIVNPLCWLQSEKALSDAAGLFFAMASVQLFFYASTSGENALRYLIFGSVMLGTCLGVRLSYFPFAILWLYTLSVLSKSGNRKKTIVYGVSAFIIGICIWLVPLACYTGVKPLIVNGFGFTSGHFSDWGGSIATSQNIISRFQDFVWCLFCNGLGFWCYDTSAFRMLPSIIMGTGIIFYLIHTGYGFKTRFIIICVLPYFLWVFLGQNLEKPRHAIPLIPLAIICISAGLERFEHFLHNYSNVNKFRYSFLSPYNLFVGILIVSMSIISTRLVYTHKIEPAAQTQLLNYVQRNYNVSSTRVYCWETKRLFEYYAPLLDIRRVRNIDDLRYDVGASLVVPEVLLSTSRVNGINSITNCSNVVAEFKNNRYISNSYHEITLYDLSLLK
ncbi:ArnT family glycosyltransferase [Candidatus Scalindua japonica]|uniref:ArnT family glycosyltransferase n=1 Tax=Candidatus Scalindua japonica TaxID=1284222 RepID=UPI000BDF5C66|nr:glycosyltransferase family 39 protein [Candidatus Scalindua japonica]